MNGHDQQGLDATAPTLDEQHEHQEWLADEQAQREYQQWLDSNDSQAKQAAHHGMNMFADLRSLVAELSRPFPAEDVKWRVGATNEAKSKGLALAYVDARLVMERLDSTCAWQDAYSWSDGKRVCCSIGIYVSGQWVYRSDGAGDTDVEGEKGAMSDAFKRAAVKWGVCRYLYSLPSPWVELSNKKIADTAALTKRLAQWQENKYGL